MLCENRQITAIISTTPYCGVGALVLKNKDFLRLHFIVCLKKYTRLNWKLKLDINNIITPIHGVRRGFIHILALVIPEHGNGDVEF